MTERLREIIVTVEVETNQRETKDSIGINHRIDETIDDFKARVLALIDRLLDAGN